MSQRKGKIGAGLFALCLLGLAAPRPDLDVALPPGSPLEWGGAFPAYTPPSTPLFPSSGTSTPESTRSTGGGTLVTPEDSEVRFSQSFQLVRILTWDLTAHMPWIASERKGPVSGVTPGRPAAPRYGDPSWWTALAPLLRLWLHPEVSAPQETLAHLVELGDPILPVLAAASAERAMLPWIETLRRLVPPGGAVPDFTPEGAPRTRALARFALEECLHDEPYDPVGSFGKRLFLFGDEVEPILAELTRHPSLALRRNAVAALARFRTRSAAEALARVAAEEKDPVTLVRALASLGGYRGRVELAPLLARARTETDPVLRAAWIGALGRLGAQPALPWLLELGETAFAKEDSELLSSVLAALAHVPPNAEHARVRALTRHVEERAQASPASWRARGPQSPGADRPDADDARARWLRELALCAAVEAEPSDEGLARALLALPGAPRNEPGSDPLAALAPGSRVLYLHALGELGEAGDERLEALAASSGLDVALRGRALALLPYDRRGRLAPMLARAPEPLELAIQALEVLRLDRRAELDPRCEALLGELLASSTLDVPAAQRYLWTFALRQCPSTKPLPRASLVTLWNLVRGAPSLQLGLRREVGAAVDALFAAVLDGLPRKRLEQELERLLVLAEPLAPARDAHARRSEVDALVDLCGDLRKHAKEEGFAAARRTEVLARLSASETTRTSSDGNFEPSVALEEEIVFTLGRTRDPAASELLLQLLRVPRCELAGEIALALARIGESSLARELVPLLLHAEPFVRLCAGEALRHLAGTEFTYDWVYAPPEERAREAEGLAARLAR